MPSLTCRLRYIPSYTHPVLYSVSMNGEVQTYLQDDRLQGVTGIVYGPDDTIIVSNFSSGAIYTISQDKKVTKLAQIEAVYPGYVLGYITYHQGWVYATGYGSNKIYAISLSGEVNELAGTGKRESNAGTAELASFMTPNGIEVDPQQNRLIITQNGNGVDMPLVSFALK